MRDTVEDREFKSILCGSQIDGFREAFFGFDYGGGGIGYFDVKVLEMRGILASLAEQRAFFCDFRFGCENQAVLEAIQRSTVAGGAMQAVEANHEARTFL